MAYGERAAFKGLLQESAPTLAIEIGTGQGGSLRRIAATVEHVHALDRAEPSSELVAIPNVTFHTGDSHELLPRLLARLASDGANVDFVLVDGDHTPEGVRRDVEALMSSPAISRTVIALHDTANRDVRAGLEAIDYAAWPRLAWVDLDWVPGFVFCNGPSQGEAWGGLGIIVVDADGDLARREDVVARYAYPAASVLAEFGRIADLERRYAALTSSRSWRVTRPLRVVRRAVRSLAQSIDLFA
jgi:hypothetical protein